MKTKKPKLMARPETVKLAIEAITDPTRRKTVKVERGSGPVTSNDIRTMDARCLKTLREIEANQK